MKSYLKLINPQKILLKKGNIFKYKLAESFFKKGIKDFYFSEINKNSFKGWKIKNKITVLIVVQGKILISYKTKESKIKNLFLNSQEKYIVLIKRNVPFKLINNTKIKAAVISFLNEKY